jgi:hypothetical protein
MFRSVVKSTFLPKREKGAWRKLRNEERSNLYYSRNIVKVIRRRRLRWTGHVEHMEALRSAQKCIKIFQKHVNEVYFYFIKKDDMT